MIEIGTEITWKWSAIKDILRYGTKLATLTTESQKAPKKIIRKTITATTTVKIIIVIVTVVLVKIKIVILAFITEIIAKIIILKDKNVLFKMC